MKRALSQEHGESAETGSSSSNSSKEMSPLKKSLTISSTANQEEIPPDKIQQFQKNAIWLRMQKYKREYELYKQVLENVVPTVKFLSNLSLVHSDTDLAAEFQAFLEQKQRSDLLSLFVRVTPSGDESADASSSDSSLPEQRLIVQTKINQELQQRYNALTRDLDKNSFHRSMPEQPNVKQSNATAFPEATADQKEMTEILDLTNATLEKRTLELQQLQESYRKSLVEIEELRLQQAEVREDENFEFLNLVKNLNFQVSSLHERIGSYERELRLTKQDLDDCFMKRKSALQEMDKEFSEREKYLNSIISQLESDVARLKNDRDSARQFMDSTKNKNDSLRANIADLQLKLDNVTIVYDSLVKENTSYKKKLALIVNAATNEGSSANLSDLSGNNFNALEFVKSAAKIPFSDAIIQVIRTEQEYAQELESVAKAFDDLSKLNSKITSKLVSKEEQISSLIADNSKCQMAYSSLYKEKESAVTKINQELSFLKDQLAQSDAKVKQSNSQLIAMEKEISSRDATVEMGKRKISELIAQVNELNYKYEQVKQKYENFTKLFPFNTSDLEQAKISCKRLDQELALCRKKLESFQKNPATASKEVLEELDICKKLLYCSSCNLRQKEVALNKCMHVFCKQCIDNRLETRQRKCPICLDPFGANDVRNIYL